MFLFLVKFLVFYLGNEKRVMSECCVLAFVAHNDKPTQSFTHVIAIGVGGKENENEDEIENEI